jgi:hypothetical protein
LTRPAHTRAARTRRSRGLALALLLVTSPAALPRAFARLENSFSIVDAGFEATDVVVAEAADPLTKRATVREVWRGHLEVGSVLLLPELAELGRPSLREARFNGYLVDSPERVSGRRVVLFLGKSSTGRWVGGSSYGDLKTSVAWVENGHAFTYEQEINPGPVVLISLVTEAELRTAVKGVAAGRERLVAAEAETNPTERVRALTRFYETADVELAKYWPSTSEPPSIAHRALRPIERAGDGARPILTEMLAKPAWTSADQSLVVSLTIGAGRAGTELALSALDQERAWWARVAPTFEPGWWADESGASFAEARVHYERARTLIDSMRRLTEGSAVPTLRAFRETWVSQPAEVAFGDHLRFALDGLIRDLSDPEPRPPTE